MYGAAALGKGEALAFLATKINDFEHLEVAPAESIPHSKKLFIKYVVQIKVHWSVYFCLLNEYAGIYIILYIYIYTYTYIYNIYNIYIYIYMYIYIYNTRKQNKVKIK